MPRKFAAGTGAVTAPAEPKSTFNTSDLTPRNRPDAISHSPAHFDSLHNHIENLRSRLEDGPFSDREKKNQDYIRVLSTVRAHIDEARTHLDNAYAAHATGGKGEDALRSGHTAVESYRRAATHVSDALNFIRSGAGFGPRLDYEKDAEITKDPSGKKTYTPKPKIAEGGGLKFKRMGMSNLGVKFFHDDRPEARPVQHSEITNLVNGYQQHVRDSLIKKGVKVPEGVADTQSSFSAGDEPSELTRQSLGRRGYPLTYEEEVVKKARQKDVRETSLKIGQQEKAKRQGRTHILPTVVTYEEGEGGQKTAKITPVPGAPIEKRKPSAYAGVGITGHSALLNAVANHFSKTYQGSFIGSEAHRNPVEYAKKHNIDLPGQQETMETHLERVGKVGAGVTSGQLAREIDVEPKSVPKLTKEEKATMGEAGVPRGKAFRDQIEGAKS